MITPFTATRIPRQLPPPRGRIDLWLCPHAPGTRSAATLGRLLAGYLGLDAPAPLEPGPHGRPRLPAMLGSPLQFNASHTGDWLLLAFCCDATPGIDIEQQRPRPNALQIAERYFDAGEAAELRALPEPARQAAFYRAWTAREAVLKALGRGLAFGLDRLRIDGGPGAPRLLALAGDDASAWQLQSVPVPDGYVAALAWRGPALPVSGFVLAGMPNAPA